MPNKNMVAEDERGFMCPSGCMGPETCVNAIQIRALHVMREALDEVLVDDTQLYAIGVVQGGLGSVAVRSEALKKHHAALYASCGLYRNEADGLITEAVDVSDMPPLD